jgi:hypothetical protein
MNGEEASFCMNMQRDIQHENDQFTEPSAQEMARDQAEGDYIDLDFHLTPNGWVMGDIRCMFGEVNWSKPAPADRVLTLTHRTLQSPVPSSRLRSVIVAWRGAATDAEIDELRAKFPPPFDPADE